MNRQVVANFLTLYSGWFSLVLCLGTQDKRKIKSYLFQGFYLLPKKVFDSSKAFLYF